MFCVIETPRIRTTIFLAPAQRLTDLFTQFAICWKWVKSICVDPSTNTIITRCYFLDTITCGWMFRREFSLGAAPGTLTQYQDVQQWVSVTYLDKQLPFIANIFVAEKKNDYLWRMIIDGGKWIWNSAFELVSRTQISYEAIQTWEIIRGQINILCTVHHIAMCRITNKMHKSHKYSLIHYFLLALHVSEELRGRHQKHCPVNCTTQSVHSCGRF